MNNEELKKQIDDLLAWKKSLEASYSIPLNIDQAFRSRFITTSGITTSTKSASSEDQAVAEAGSATYNVLKSPDAFLQVSINGAVKYIPIFT